MIRLKNVHYAYQCRDGSIRPALVGITLDVNKGEIVALSGPNGSGKTSLALCMAGLLTPTEGSITVDDDDLSPGEDKKLPVGLVFQDPDDQLLAPTVEEEVAFGLENRSLPSAEIRGRVDRVLQQFGLYGLRYRAPHQLSGGEKQRLALASVFALEPAYIVLDEATSLLDPRGRREVREALCSLRSSVGILLITQLEEEAIIADRLAIMAGGRLQECGSPRELAARRVLHTAVTQVVDALRQRGIDLPTDIMCDEDLVRALDRIKSGQDDQG
jgi:energy-coupling factor transport system ATP-binding protein